MIAAVKKILSVAEAGGVPPDNAAELFELYIDSILAGGERLHLFSRSELTPRRVTDHHILDAVAALHFARPKKGARLLDYGAGSGVVGITWKILRPDLQLVLLESMKRKASFLKGALRVLDLEGAEVWTGRGEDFARSDPATIDFLVSRGVASNRKTARAIRELLRPFGQVLFFKGPATVAEIGRLIKGDKELSLLREETITLCGDKERILVQASKVHIEK